MIFPLSPSQVAVMTSINHYVLPYLLVSKIVCLCNLSHGGMKENSGGGEFKYDIFDTL
jgi:hypothetical protein